MFQKNKKYKKYEDRELVLMYRDGNDQAALETLIARHQDEMRFVIVKYGHRNTEVIEDLFIEAVFKISNAIKTTFEEGKSVRSFLTTIAGNHAIDAIRKANHAPVIYSIKQEGEKREDGGGTYHTSIASNPNETPEKLFANSQMKEENIKYIRRLLVEVERLSKDAGEILILRYFNEMSYDEIAEFMDLPLGTVKARLFRSRQMIHDLHKTAEANWVPA
ncbi:MAG: rpoE [Patescibacteria group bacterium]|nr:rpoE [Patescibacteria group bacterium]